MIAKHHLTSPFDNVQLTSQAETFNEMEKLLVDGIYGELCKIFQLSHPSINHLRLLQNAQSLIRAPLISTIRLNTLTHDGITALELIKELLASDLKIKNLVATIHPNFSDLILIAPQNKTLTPPNIIPHQRRAIISRECAQAVLRGALVYAPGVLAIESSPSPNSNIDFTPNLLDDNSCNHDWVSVWADLEEKCTRGLLQRYSGKVLFVGNGTLLMARKELFTTNQGHLPSGIAIKMHQVTQPMPSFDTLTSSIFYPQNLPSYLAVKELDVQPGMMALDMCASPGGKSTHIATELGNHGLLICTDKNEHKVALLRRNLQRWGVTCAQALVADATHFILPSEIPNGFDRILLDPPCSGVGQRPWLKDKFNQHQPTVDYSSYQKRLARRAAQLLAPGGILVYSTCTMAVEENEAVVQDLLNNTNLILVPPTFDTFGSPGIVLVSENVSHDRAILPTFPCHLVRRFWPNGPDDTIAFFYAKFTKPVSQDQIKK